MKLKRLFFFACALLLALLITAFIMADSDPIQRAAAELEKWVSTYPFEKVYLQTDKPYYAIGDDIWFKAYVTVGGQHELSAISKVLSVELINERDSVVKYIKLPVTSGLAWGDFNLDDSLKEGYYRIRAYTNYMRNAGSDYFFDKTISIIYPANVVFTRVSYSITTENGIKKINTIVRYNDVKGAGYAAKPVIYQVKTGGKTIARGKAITGSNGDISISFPDNFQPQSGDGEIESSIKVSDKTTIAKTVRLKTPSTNVDVQFFPESGNLVTGISTTVAFKAVGPDGLGANISGTITDDENRTVAQFATQHAGMGSFTIRPQSGRRYKAHITYADGAQNDIDLPHVEDKGYVIGLHDIDSTKISVRISASRPQMLADSMAIVSLVAQAGGKIYYAAKTAPGSSTFQTTLPKNKFPSGIVQFTLFSATGDPLNERLVFIQHPDQLKLNLSETKAVYSPREKVNINLNALNKEEKPVTGSFSVAVTNETDVPVNEAHETTIFSNLLLTSDLKGYIEEPNYYFTNVSSKTRADLDVLMLTQGYRRFEWKQLMNDVFQPIVFLPEKALEIAGHIKTPGGKAVAHGKVTLFSSAGGGFLLDTVSDENGRFVFNNLIFKDSVKFVVQARTDKNRKNVEIELDNIKPPLVTKTINAAEIQVNDIEAPTPFLLSSREAYSAGNHAVMLRDVVIRAQKEPLVKNSSNLNGAGNADQIIKPGDVLLGCAQLADCLQGRILGVVFRNGVPYSTRSLNTPMQIVLDGSYVPVDILNSLQVSNIESIEVLRSIQYTAIYGGQGGGGLLLINTKRGGDNSTYTTYSPGLINTRPKGYYSHRVFYSPQYDDPKTPANKPDLRTTIYWNPNIITDKNGNTSFGYFNADGKGTYRVVVEGIDQDGNLGRLVYRYNVE